MFSNKILITICAGSLYMVALNAQSTDLLQQNITATNDLDLTNGMSHNFYEYNYCVYNPYDPECVDGGGIAYPYGSTTWGYGRGGRYYGRHHGHHEHHRDAHHGGHRDRGHHGGQHHGGGHKQHERRR